MGKIRKGSGLVSRPERTGLAFPGLLETAAGLALIGNDPGRHGLRARGAKAWKSLESLFVLKIRVHGELHNVLDFEVVADPRAHALECDASTGDARIATPPYYVEMVVRVDEAMGEALRLADVGDPRLALLPNDFARRRRCRLALPGPAGTGNARSLGLQASGSDQVIVASL